jgi:cation diffusion facilitator CzcD-associated flavoprotein CzcO
MATSLQPTPAAQAGPVEQFDAIIIGAGISGLYQLIRLPDLGLTVRVYEAGSGVGGTWYWNRYPGARFDSESYSYGYSFSKELLQEWDWKEHFSGQPENERYLNYVADKFELRRDIRFNVTVDAAIYDEKENYWEVRIDDGTCARARLLITAVGILSAQNIPGFAGIESFKGRVVSHRSMAQGTRRLYRQTRRRDRHGRHGRPAHHGNRQGGRPSDGLPAHGEFLRAAAQRSDRS